MSMNGEILTALKNRLSGITINNGYPLTVKHVELNKGEIIIDLPNSKLPYIEIINGDDRPLQTNPGGSIKIGMDITLRLAMPKSASDLDMSDFQSCVIRCLYGNSYIPAANPSACRLNDGSKDLITTIEYQGTFTDINLINANRVWDINIGIIFHRSLMAF